MRRGDTTRGCGRRGGGGGWGGYGVIVAVVAAVTRGLPRTRI